MQRRGRKDAAVWWCGVVVWCGVVGAAARGKGREGKGREGSRECGSCTELREGEREERRGEKLAQVKMPLRLCERHFLYIKLHVTAYIL